MNLSASADNGIVSAVRSSFQSDGGKRLKERLQLVAKKHGQKKLSEEQLGEKAKSSNDNPQSSNNQDVVAKNSTSNDVMNGAQSPFLPGWPVQRDMYQGTAAGLPPMSPSLSPLHHANQAANQQMCDPRFYQLFAGGFSREHPNGSHPSLLPSEQKPHSHPSLLPSEQKPHSHPSLLPSEQKPHSGAISPFSRPTSANERNIGPVNSYNDGRKQMISNIGGNSDFKNTFNSYQAGSDQIGITASKKEDYLTAAHNAMLQKSGFNKTSRQLSSPFTPIQNDQFQPIKSPFSQESQNGPYSNQNRMVTPNPNESVPLNCNRSVTPNHNRSVTPTLNRSITPNLNENVPSNYNRSVTPNLERSLTPQFYHGLNSPNNITSHVDFRPENLIQTQYANEQTTKSAHFWPQSKFSSHNLQSSRNSEVLQNSPSVAYHQSQYETEKLMPKPKTTKVKKQKSGMFKQQQNQQNAFPNAAFGQASSEAQQEIKQVKRKKVVADPNIKELVDAKVQEIMAAYKQKDVVKIDTTDVEIPTLNTYSEDPNSVVKPSNPNRYNSGKPGSLENVHPFQGTTSRQLPTSSSDNYLKQFKDTEVKDSIQTQYYNQNLFSPSQDLSLNSNIPKQQPQGTIHYNLPSSLPQNLSYSKEISLNEQIEGIRSMRKERRSQSPEDAVSLVKSSQQVITPNSVSSYSKELSLTQQIAEVRNTRKERASPSTVMHSNEFYSHQPDLYKNKSSLLTEQINEVRNMRKDRPSPDNTALGSQTLTKQITEVRNMRKPLHSPVHAALDSNKEVYNLEEKLGNQSVLHPAQTSVFSEADGLMERNDKNKRDIGNESNSLHMHKQVPSDYRQISAQTSPFPDKDQYNVHHKERLSPCCVECGKVGVRYSVNCQNRKTANQGTDDPYNFDAFEEQHQQLLKEYSSAKCRSIENESKYDQSYKSSVSQDTKVTKDLPMGTSKSSSEISSSQPKGVSLVGNMNLNPKFTSHMQQNVTDHPDVKTSHPFASSSNTTAKNSDSSIVSSSVSSGSQPSITKSLPQFSSTWGSSSHYYSQMVERECASVQERSKLPPADPASGLNQMKSPVKGKRGRKPKDKSAQAALKQGNKTDKLLLDPRLMSAAGDTLGSSGLQSSNNVTSQPMVANSLLGVLPTDSESIITESKTMQDYNSTVINEGELRPLEASTDTGRLPEDSGIGMEIDDDKLTSLPDGVSPEKVSKIKEQIANLQMMVTGDNDEVHDRLATNKVIDVPKCSCLGPNGHFNESVEGPYYTHLGAARSVKGVREILEKRTGTTGTAIRIEKVRYTGKEGRSSQGCPIAKWIIRRSGPDEKYLCVVRHRAGHTCETAWLMIALVAWEGVPTHQADDLYDYLCNTLPKNGFETERRCGTNERKTCACQGANLLKRGASFSFGCSWSMYFNGCKFARSREARKFKLKDTSKEPVLEDKLQDLATHVGPLYQQMAPDAYHNQSYYSTKAAECRLGKQKGGPFSGVTACVDFCAHAHRDFHNMQNGSTVVVTLTKHRGFSKPDDEQLHVLPLYVLETTDEEDSFDAQCEKIENGSLEVLHHYPLEARMRSHPLIPEKKRKALAKKEKDSLKSSPGRKRAVSPQSGRQSPWGSSSSATSTPKKPRVKKEPLLHSQDSNQSLPEGSQSSQGGSLAGTPIKHDTQTNKGSNHHKTSTHDKQLSYDDLMAYSTQAGFTGLYESFWDYFYTNGVFPPSSFLSSFTGSKQQSDGKTAGQKVSEGSHKQTTGHLMSNTSLSSQTTNTSDSLVSSNSPSTHTSAINRVPISGDSNIASIQDHTNSTSNSSMNKSTNSGHSHPSNHSNSSAWNKMAANNRSIYSSEQRHLHDDKPIDLHRNGYVKGSQNVDSNKPNGFYSKDIQPVKTENFDDFFKRLQSGNPTEAHKSRESNIHFDRNRQCANSSNSNLNYSAGMDKTVLSSGVNVLEEDDSVDDGVLDLSSSGNFSSFKSVSTPKSEPGDRNNTNQICFGSPWLDVDKTQKDLQQGIQSNEKFSPSEMAAMPTKPNDSSNSGEKTPTSVISYRPESSTSNPYTDTSWFGLDNNNSRQRNPSNFSQNAYPKPRENVNPTTNSQVPDRAANNSGNIQDFSSPGTKMDYNMLSPNHKVNRLSENSLKVTGQANPLSSNRRDSLVQQSVDNRTEDTNLVTGHYQRNKPDLRHVNQQRNKPDLSSVNQHTVSSSSKLEMPGQNVPGISDASKVPENKSQGHSYSESITITNPFESPSKGTESSSANFIGFDSFQKGWFHQPNDRTKYSSNVSDNKTNDKDVKPIPPKMAQTPSSSFSHSESEKVQPSPDYTSPLHLLSQAVEIRTKDPPNINRTLNHWPNEAVHNQNNVHQDIKSQFQHAINHQLNQQGGDAINEYKYNPDMLTCKEQLSLNTPEKSGMYQAEECVMDPDVVKCEMEYNENAFHDPLIGGVAISLCHGAVLFEVAKRELHATTGLRNPDRYQPTRISLVFYQHKNLNNEDHGWHVYAKKLEDMKQQRIAKMQEQRGMVDMEEIENSFKGGKKKKKKTEDEKEEEVIDFSKTSAAQYRYMWECNAKHAQVHTTNTVSTKWIKPEPMVSGPYQKWV